MVNPINKIAPGTVSQPQKTKDTKAIQQQVGWGDEDGFEQTAVKGVVDRFSHPVKTVTLTISGGPIGQGVQKVGLRSHLARLALTYGLSGSVENIANPPTVRLVIQGNPFKIKQLQSQLSHIDNDRIKIDTVSESNEEPETPVKPGKFTVENWTSSSRDLTKPVTIELSVNEKGINEEDAKKEWEKGMKKAET